MPKIKKSSKSDVPLIYLKWLVTVLSVVMILGFLFLVAILGLKIFNFNNTSQALTEVSDRDIVVPNGKIESIDIENSILSIIVKAGETQLEVIVIDLKNGVLLNQYSIKQKKSPYNK